MKNLVLSSSVELKAAIPAIVAGIKNGDHFTVSPARMPSACIVSYAVFNAERWWGGERHIVAMENNGLPRSWRAALTKAIYSQAHAVN